MQVTIAQDEGDRRTLWAKPGPDGSWGVRIRSGAAIRLYPCGRSSAGRGEARSGGRGHPPPENRARWMHMHHPSLEPGNPSDGTTRPSHAAPSCWHRLSSKSMSSSKLQATMACSMSMECSMSTDSPVAGRSIRPPDVPMGDARIWRSLGGLREVRKIVCEDQGRKGRIPWYAERPLDLAVSPDGKRRLRDRSMAKCASGTRRVAGCFMSSWPMRSAR